MTRYICTSCEAFWSHPWRFSSPEWTSQGPPAARWPGELPGSFPPGIILPWSFLQATLRLSTNVPLARVLILRGIFPPFPHLLSEPWVWIQAGILQDAPQGRQEGFSMTCLSVPVIPRGSRTGWFHTQPRPPSQIPCVHQEGSICGLIHDPCDCPQKMLGPQRGPDGNLCPEKHQLWWHRETSLNSLSTGEGQFDGAASALAAGLRVWDAPCHGLHCLGSSQPCVPQFPLVKGLPVGCRVSFPHPEQSISVHPISALSLWCKHSPAGTSHPQKSPGKGSTSSALH